MASMKNPDYAAYLIDQLLAGSRGRPPAEKVRKGMDPKTRRFPNDERVTRQMMQGKRRSPDKPTTEYSGPHDLNYDETLLLRSMRPRSGMTPSHGFDFEDFGFGMTGGQVHSALRTGDKTRGGSGKLPKDVRTKRSIDFVGPNASKMLGYDLMKMLGVDKKTLDTLASMPPEKLKAAVAKIMSKSGMQKDVVGDITSRISDVNKPPKKKTTGKYRESQKREAGASDEFVDLDEYMPVEDEEE